MRTAVISALWAICALTAAPAAGQMGFSSDFEEGRGEGTGEDSIEATKNAQRNAISAKLSQMVAKGELRDHSGLAKAVNYVAKKYTKYIATCRVVSRKKTDVTIWEKGRSEVVEGCEITVKVVLNKALLEKDLIKALRMAELAKYGKRVAVLLEEWVGTPEEGALSPHGYTAQTVERAFMTLRVKTIPIQSLRVGFQAQVAGGRRLESNFKARAAGDPPVETEFKKNMLAELKGLGGDILIVGSVSLVFVEDKALKVEKDRRDYIFEVTGWVEIYDGDEVELRGSNVIKKATKMTSPARNEKEARSLLFSRIGEGWADDLIDQAIADKKDEEEEKPFQSFILVFENALVVHRTDLPRTITALECVEECKPMRFGRGLLILRAKVTGKTEIFLRDIEGAMKGAGFRLRKADANKIIFMR
jgi:hypothetical protein